jgi:hypothetical protein
MVGASAGIDGTFMRVIVRNVMSGHELTIAGYLFGGYLDPITKIPIHIGSKHPSNPKDLLKPVGDEVTFETKEAEDFDFWVGSENGQWVRVVHGGIGVIRKVETTLLKFTRLDIGSLVFEYKKSWALPTLNLSVVAGILKVEGPVPSDFVDDTAMVTVPTQIVGHNYDGLLLSFPTGKAGLHDLTSKDQKRLTDFVTNKARAIAGLASSGFRVANPP